MKLDWNKPIETKGGLEVTILTKDGQDKNFPVVGEIKLSDNGDFVVSKWDINGYSVTDQSFDVVQKTLKMPTVVVMVRIPGASFALGCFDSIQEAEEHVSLAYRGAMIVGSAETTLT